MNESIYGRFFPSPNICTDWNGERPAWQISKSIFVHIQFSYSCHNKYDTYYKFTEYKYLKLQYSSDRPVIPSDRITLAIGYIVI